MIWKIWKKGKSNSDKLWTMWKKGKSNSEKIGKYGERPSRIVKRQGNMEKG